MRTAVAANRHSGQAGYSHNPPQEVRDEESSLRADPGEEGEGQASHAAACEALERQCQIPGLGPFIAAGPIMAGLAGLGVGGAVGGITRALIGMGIPRS